MAPTTMGDKRLHAVVAAYGTWSGLQPPTSNSLRLPEWLKACQYTPSGSDLLN